jgi:hypothetical protein
VNKKRFNIQNKRQVLYTVLDEDSGHSILTSLHDIYFYFWHMKFYTLHEYIYIYRIINHVQILIKVLCFFSKFDSVKKIKSNNKINKQTNKTQKKTQTKTKQTKSQTNN